MAFLYNTGHGYCSLISHTGSDLGLSTSKYGVNIPHMSVVVLPYYLESDEITSLFLLL